MIDFKMQSEMNKINTIFARIEKLTNSDGHCGFVTLLQNATLEESGYLTNNSFTMLKAFLQKIFDTIDELAEEIRKDDTILISVKNQKLLRSCFQIITSIGISPCLIPGLGINLSKRCATAKLFPSFPLNDDQKYKTLVTSTEFFARSYSIPVLKNIILTLHLSDYLAALIQLSFAPFKTPGTYSNFVMTEEKYAKLTADRLKYVQVYNHLVTNCFQPILMKELLVLQSGTDPSPPMFVKRVIGKEMSQRLIAPGGLLSLIRCFIESYNIDTGFEWKKIDMICRIIVAKHGTGSEIEYLINICSQLRQILCLNNTHYLSTAVACVLRLKEQYPQSDSVMILLNEIFQSFNYDYLITNYNLPGTIIFSSQDVDKKINILHACVSSSNLDWSVKLITPNLFLINLIGMKCSKNEELIIKVKDIIIRSLEKLKKDELRDIVNMFLFGKDQNSPAITVEEYEAGLTVKGVSSVQDYAMDEAVVFLLTVFKTANSDSLVRNIFEVAISTLIDVSVLRSNRGNRDFLVTEDNPLLMDDIDEKYATVLTLLSEITTSPKIINALKTNPLIVSNFIEHFILKQKSKDDECKTIALLLLNTILSNSDRSKDLILRFRSLVPALNNLSENDTGLINILCAEALQIITSGKTEKKNTACEKAISDIFDDLLPVRAHGIIELTKLIDAKDPETISKKHYIFCIFQEQLKDPDSYIYLSAINGLASLCSHCTEDVLFLLCKEFIEGSNELQHETMKSQNSKAELKMKIGDVIVKVTKKLGGMAVVHKTILLNTMLCACRDVDPLIRTSALSNLAEIALVLHYKIGSIIYEVLLCIWNIIETDKAIECRRAAVMVISSLLKGLGKDTLVQLKENLLPIYRTLKNLYSDINEDDTVRLHAQLALEELNSIVNQFLFPELKMEKQIFILDKPQDVFK